jgi:hypothetical protein
VTRAILCISLSLLTLALGLFTAGLQSDNYERGLALNDLKEQCSMLEAINGDQAAQILDRDCAPLPIEPKPDLKPAPKAPLRPRDAQSIAQAASHAAPAEGPAP